jgi:hypothetical protein
MTYVRDIPSGQWTGANIDNGKIQIDMPVDPAHYTVNDLHESYWVNLSDWGGGGTGSSSFIGLTDVPATYAGTALYVVRVNAAADALEFVDPGSLGLLDETAHDLLDHTGLTGVGSGDMILASVQSVTGEKTFDTTKAAIKGSSTGKNIIAAANASATNYTNTLPAKTGTFAMTDTSMFDATIGTGGDYATVYDAFVAGKTKIKLVSNVTETQSPAITGIFYLFGDNYNWTCNYQMTLTGYLYLQNINIYTNYLGSSVTAFIKNTSVFAEKVLFDFNHVSGTMWWMDTSISYFNNCVITFHGQVVRSAKMGTGSMNNTTLNLTTNITTSGSVPFYHTFPFIYSNISIQGTHTAGAAVFNADIGSKVIFNNVTVTTANYPHVSVNTIFTTLQNCTYLNISILANTVTTILNSTSVINGTFCNGLIIKDNSTVALATSNATTIGKIYCENSNLTIYNPSPFAALVISDFTCISSTIGGVALSNSSHSILYKLTKSTITAAINIYTDYCKIDTCKFDLLLTLSSGAEYNVIQGNTLTGGLTDSSGSATNIIKDNI